MKLWKNIKKECISQIRSALTPSPSKAPIVSSVRSRQPKKYELVGRIMAKRKNAIDQSYRQEIIDFESYVYGVIKRENVPLKIAQPEEMLRRLFPDNDASLCPRCRYNFEKPLSRGRVCPQCHDRLRVRNGYLLSEGGEERYQHAYRVFWATSKALYSIEAMKSNIGNNWFRYYESAKEMADTYESLGDYNRAWDCFSGKYLMVLEGTTMEASSYDSVGDDFLRVYLWRAEFLDRCLREGVWNVTPEWVVESYIEIIAHAYNLELSLTIITVENAIRKIKNFYQEGTVGANKIREFIYSSKIDEFNDKEKEKLMRKVIAK